MASNFSRFVSSHANAGIQSLLTDPLLHGLANAVAGTVVSIGNITGCTPEPGSPVTSAGVHVIWPYDYAGQPLPAMHPSIGPYQG